MVHGGEWGIYRTKIMILKLIKKLLHHFNYEVVSFAEMTFYGKAVNQRYDIANGTYRLSWLVDYVDGSFVVKTRGGSPVCITVKNFSIEDYGSEEYARACAEELCNKLNEKA